MEIFTLGRWVVRPGKQEEFVAAWSELGAFFGSLEHPPPPGSGTLLGSLDDPTLFYSFGPWEHADHVAEMRAHPETPGRIGALVALCTEATPGGFAVVARA
jgi:hypothetical protein